MKPFLALLLLALLASTAFASPLSWNVGAEATEDASKSITNRLSGLALNSEAAASHPRPLGFNVPDRPGLNVPNRPALDVPVRPADSFVQGELAAPRRHSGPIRTSKGAARDTASPYQPPRLFNAVKKIVKAKKLERQEAIKKGQWDKVLEAIHRNKAAGPGQGASNSAPNEVGRDLSRFNEDTKDTATSRWNF